MAKGVVSFGQDQRVDAEILAVPHNVALPVVKGRLSPDNMFALALAGLLLLQDSLPWKFSESSGSRKPSEAKYGGPVSASTKVNGLSLESPS